MTSFNPLEAFIYREGFARFCSRKYSTNPEYIHDERIHLTNSSIQKHYLEEMEATHPAIVAGVNGGGNKVRLTWMWKRLATQGVDVGTLWKKVNDLCVKTLCCVEEDIPFQPNSFEVFGFDVMFDDQLKPWLVEVNACPAVARESNLDACVKEEIIIDTVKLVSPPKFNRHALAKVCKRRLSCSRKVTQTAGTITEKDELEKDLREILMGKLPRRYGEMPESIGNYERLAPATKFYDRLKR